MEVGDVITLGKSKYEVVELLGEGSYAKAFRVSPVSPNRLLTRIARFISKDRVIKVPSAFVQSQVDGIQRFKREARILGNIDHPNVVEPHVPYAVDEGLVLVQELVKQAKPLPEFL